MSTFSLSAAVRAVIDETNIADPRELAAKVAEGVPSKHLRDALAEALATYVRVQFTRDREPVPVPVPNRSAKVAALQAHAERWRRVLLDRVHVGNGCWSLLTDCSYDHLMFMVAERRANAAANLAAADRYAALADLVQHHRVARVGDLPDTVLRGALAESEAAAA